MLAAERMHSAWQTWKYKAAFDELYLTREFDSITHDVITLEVEEPTLAASALFSVGDRDRRGKLLRSWRRLLRRPERGADWVGVCLTVLPLTRKRTVALLSYLPRDARQVRRKLRPLLTAPGARQKFELSRLVLNYCQNLALSPKFVESWSPQKRSTIVDLFRRTVLQKEPTFEDPELNLFA